MQDFGLSMADKARRSHSMSLGQGKAARPTTLPETGPSLCPNPCLFLGAPGTSHSIVVHLSVLFFFFIYMFENWIRLTSWAGKLSNFHKELWNKTDMSKNHATCFHSSLQSRCACVPMPSTWLLIIWELYLSYLATVSYLKYTFRFPGWHRVSFSF